MEVFLASPRGFCAGVVLAVEIVELALQRYGAPVYVKHQIVHNPSVVAELEAKGAITVDQVWEVPDGSVVVFSAHGSPPSDYEQADRKNLKVIDATCPLVTKVHNEAKKYFADGKKIILVGHRGHQEVIGTTGQSNMVLLDDREDTSLPDWEEETEVAVLTQTTLSVRDTARAVEQIQSKYPHALVRNDICYATTNRQNAVVELAAMVEVILVIGASNSSNCNRLKEVAEAEGVKAYLINGPSELDKTWLNGVKRVGITSGASTPEKMVMATVEAVKPDKVTYVGSGNENITFRLPNELRNISRPDKPTPE